MNYSKFKLVVLARVSAILLTCIFLVDSYYDNSFFLLKIFAIGLLVIQVIWLLKYLDQTNKDLTNFFKAIKYDDFSRTYSISSDTDQDELYQEFNKVIKKFKEIRIEKEMQHNYLKTIIHHVGIGIITFDEEGNIHILNKAAKSLLGLQKTAHNLDELKNVSEELISSFLDLKTGGRELLKIERAEEDVQLSIYAIELVQKQKAFKLISIQNIKNELEEMEMDAWQNLVRVLTHEIMNSVTPISSLSATIDSNIESALQGSTDTSKLTEEDVDDIRMSFQTIHKRSEGLIRFVSDFRNLTRISIPKLEALEVTTLIKPLLSLHSMEIEKEKINVSLEITPDNLKIQADLEQIEQVFINLLKNAMQAVAQNDELKKEKRIEILAGHDSYGNTFVKIKDNGSGIEEEAKKRIFVPFFTTKKSGSGIGLSLSKQIMRKHNGNITVNSELNKGSEFTLNFKPTR